MKDNKRYECKYCGKQCIGISGLHFHENRCNENPNRIIYKHKIKCCIVHNEIGFKKIYLHELENYLSNGWTKGYGPSKRVSHKVFTWITNGKINKQIDLNDDIPNGWYKGLTFFNKNIGKCKDPQKEILRREKISKTAKQNKKSGVV